MRAAPHEAEREPAARGGLVDLRMAAANMLEKGGGLSDKFLILLVNFTA